MHSQKETGDMPPKRAFWTHSRQEQWLRRHVKIKIEILIFTPAMAMGSCIKVVKQINLVSY
jgi:hypothetical protein